MPVRDTFLRSLIPARRRIARAGRCAAGASRVLLAGACLIAGCAPAPTPDPQTEPAAYASPLVRLQQLVGDNDHLHVDEVRYRAADGKLFQCAYQFGVVDARDPTRMRYLAQGLRHAVPGDPRAPGCIHLAADGDVVYTTHRGNIDNPAFLSGWDLRPHPDDPSVLDPVQLPVLQEPGVSYEGIDVANGYIYVALRRQGLGIYDRDVEGGFRRVGAASGFSNAWGVRVRGTLAFVTDGLDGLAVVDVADPRQPRVIGRVETGGQARGLAVGGDIVYVAAGSRGLVLVDVSDAAAPAVVGRADDVPTTAIRVDYADGRAYVAAWSDVRAYDVADPAAPRFLGAARLTRDLRYPDAGRPPVTSRTLGVAAAGDAVLVGNWHVLYSYQVHPARLAPNIVLPETVNLLDFGRVADAESRAITVPVGNQGTAPLTILAVTTDNPSFAVAPGPLRLAPGETREVEVRYTASGPAPASSLLEFQSNDPAEAVRRGFLTANQPGLGIGQPLPEVRVDLVDGGQWSSGDAVGDVVLLAYFATF